MATKKATKKAVTKAVSMTLDKQEQDLINKFRALKAAVAKERAVDNEPGSYDIMDSIDSIFASVRYDD